MVLPLVVAFATVQVLPALPAVAGRDLGASLETDAGQDLFAGYHLHVPWAIPIALIDTFVFAYASRRYRSALIGICVHSAQSVVLTLNARSP